MSRSMNHLRLSGEQPGAIYDALPFYDADLAAHHPMRSDAFPVEMARHHIIPKEVLRDFWNMLIDDGTFRYLDAFFRTLREHVDGQDTNLSPTGRGSVVMSLDLIVRGEAGPGAPILIDDLNKVYIWMPGNLFIGPKGDASAPFTRRDDAGADFEARAHVVVSDDREWRRLADGWAAIRRYMTGSRKSHRDVQDAGRALAAIARRAEIYPFDRRHWGRVGPDDRPRYQIRA